MNVKPNLLDNFIGVFSPKAKNERLMHKAKFQSYKAFVDSNGYQTQRGKNRSLRALIDVTANDPNYDAGDKLESLRALSRDLKMNAPLAGAGINRTVQNVVGSGLMLQSRIDRDFLNISDEEADRWEKDVERRFLTWSKNPDCDITRKLNFYQMQGLVLDSTLTNGDIFALFPYKKRIGMSNDLKIRLIEADLCRSPLEVNNFSGSIDKASGGIELNPDGSPLAYHFAKKYPGRDITADFKDQYTTMRIPAYSRSGRKNVYHLMFTERPGQKRGTPLLAPIVEKLKNITRLSEAELESAIVASYFTAFVKDKSGYAAPFTEGFVPPSITKDESGNKYPEDVHNVEMGAAQLIYLDDDKDITIASNPRPSGTFEPFWSALIKEIAANINVPYEILMMNFTASYSASRAALLEAEKYFRTRKSWLVDSFCQVAYENWLTEEVISGRIEAPGFLEDPEIKSAWLNSKWTGQGSGQLDELKETKAAIMRIEGNISSYEDEIIKINGSDWDRTIDRKAREVKKLKEKDLLKEVAGVDNPQDPQIGSTVTG